MPLTHVCVWDKKGWKRITIAEASKMHPRGSVSAKSGLFMCELCGQYVSMTQAGIRDSYFKHSKEQDDKNCPERTFGTGGWEATYNTLQLETKGMPLKIVVNGGSFKIQVGLYVLPDELYDLNNRVSIAYGSNKKVYSFERLNRFGITYLDVGNDISDKYSLYVVKDAEKLKNYWQFTFKGITGSSLFDKYTGKKLSRDADVKLNEIYYALTRSYFVSNYSSVDVKRIASKGYWHLYEVKATSFDEYSARFFLDYFSCRLTDIPISMTFVWPLSIETPYLIYHRNNIIYTYIQGNGTFKMFPYTYQSSIALKNGKLVPVRCNDRQQILAVGRTVNILDYTYLWVDDLNLDVKSSDLSVKDIKGNEINSGTSQVEPEKKSARITTQYDGRFEVLKDGWVVFKSKLQSGQEFTFDRFENGFKYRIYQGVDCVWELEINKRKKVNKLELNEDDLLKQLKTCKGKEITISHAYGNTAQNMKGYPKIKQWLFLQIKKGSIPLDAKQIIEKRFI